MRVAQIADGRVSVVWENDPRAYAGENAYPSGISLVDVTNVEGIDVGWFGRRVAGQWVFAATHNEIEQAASAIEG